MIRGITGKRPKYVSGMKLSMHGSKVTGGIKECDPPTHEQAKSNKMLIPEQGCYVTQFHVNKYNTPDFGSTMVGRTYDRNLL